MVIVIVVRIVMRFLMFGCKCWWIGVRVVSSWLIWVSLVRFGLSLLLSVWCLSMLC